MYWNDDNDVISFNYLAASLTVASNNSNKNRKASIYKMRKCLQNALHCFASTVWATECSSTTTVAVGAAVGAAAAIIVVRQTPDRPHSLIQLQSYSTLFACHCYRAHVFFGILQELLVCNAYINTMSGNCFIN